MRIGSLFVLSVLLVGISILTSCLSTQGTSTGERVFEEVNGVIAVEAEDFTSQSLKSKREWYKVGRKNLMFIKPDIDGNHSASASGEIYLEALPDTRTNHDEELVVGENFSNEPGKLAILNYRVYFNNIGKYYVWVRAFSTGTEDNGIHVGIDGTWDISGQRMQWCEGRNTWRWESKQRTEEEHCGEERRIFLNVNNPGFHTISFSMREDGFEFDKWLMSKDYVRPIGNGPEPVLKE